MLDHQKAFDTMLTHLRQQGELAVLPGSCTCVYRTDDGLKCAVGALIPDENYDPKIESYSLDYVVTRLIPNATSDDVPFLVCAQASLHDGLIDSNGNFLADLERAAIDFAHRYSLEYTAPTCTLTA